jgi:ABC-type xylose transport system permease subunit
LCQAAKPTILHRQLLHLCCSPNNKSRRILTVIRVTRDQLEVGMTFVILAAGTDLNVGSLLAFPSSIVAPVLTRSLFPWPVAWAVSGAAVLAIAAV